MSGFRFRVQHLGLRFRIRVWGLVLGFNDHRALTPDKLSHINRNGDGMPL